jgi:hypothetical protein
MNKYIAVLAFLLASACSQNTPGPAISPTIPSFPAGAHYSDARAQLLQAGWSPVPAKCGNGYICFEEFPELATNLSDGVNSGLFVSGNYRVRIYTRPIADGQLVERVEHVR